MGGRRIAAGKSSQYFAELTRSRADLLVVPDYSRDADATCPKCQETEAFRLAAPQTSILGYC
jgi:hypothetical protein